MKADFSFLSAPKPTHADKARARRAALTGERLASHDRACAAFAAHLAAEIEADDSGEEVAS